MADFTLKVSLDKLQSKASEITDQIKEIENNWKQLSGIVAKSKSYWKGDASELHQKYCSECEEAVLEILKRLKEHPKDLLEIMGIYNDVEEEVVAITQSLPDDVIV